MSDIRWFTDTDDGHSSNYVERFRELSAEGSDLEGEARMVDAMAAPRSRILDAGCGQGRTGAALARRGHSVVGLDVDPVLLDAARVDNPGPTYIQADLATLDLVDEGQRELFDACVMAGNVITFVAPGTETAVLTRLRAHVRPDGFLVTGFHTERMDVVDFDRYAREAGWTIESRFATWDLRPWRIDSDFAVTVLR